MAHGSVRRLGWTLLVLASILGAGMTLRWLERVLMFPAPSAPARRPRLDGASERRWFRTPGGRVEAFLLRPDPPADGPRPLLLYAHGNGELVDDWLREFAPLRAAGVAILLVEYPGYGRSTGTPSETSIRDVLVAGYDWARARPGIDPERIVGYGRSIGGGAICALGRERSLAALVLESTFTSIRDVANERFRVPRFLMPNRFENLAFVRGYRSPVLVLHGEEDELIPPSQARRLAAAAPRAELALERCGHGCPEPWPRVIAFLHEHGLL